VASGVETGSSGGSVNRGPQLLGAPSPGPKNGGEVIHLAENTKRIKTLGIGGLHRFPDLVASPRAPKPHHLHSQHFGIPVLALGGRPMGLRAPRLLLNHGPSEPCYATVCDKALHAATQGDRDFPRTRAVIFGSRAFAVYQDLCANSLLSYLNHHLCYLNNSADN